MRVLHVLVLLLVTPLAHAGRVTDLATSYDEKGIVNAGIRLSYERTLKRGAIKRELSGRDPSGVQLVKELRFSQTRHILDLKAEVAFLKAIQLYLEFPIVLSDERSYDFAQNGGDPCGDPLETNCVTPRNSTLVRDGFLKGAAMSANQIAVAGPSAVPGGLQLPKRSGLDQFYLGLVGAPLSQARDATKPTWLLGFEARVGVSSPMEYDPGRPLANTSVGTGLNQFKWWMSVSRRYKYLDPWFTLFYILPDAKGDSLLERTRFPLSGQERSDARQRGGGEVGIEIIPYDRPDRKHKVAIELALRLEGIFEGRDYSEIWELFANNPRLAGPCRSSADSLRPDFWKNGGYCASPTDTLPFPGVTNIDNYAIFSGSFAVSAEITRFLRARIGVGLGHEQQHFITFGDAGRSAAPNLKIDLRDEAQVNPLYRPLIDSVGRRFRAAETTTFDFFISATGQF